MSARNNTVYMRMQLSAVVVPAGCCRCVSSDAGRMLAPVMCRECCNLQATYTSLVSLLVQPVAEQPWGTAGK
jgi:hypothetical protein